MLADFTDSETYVSFPGMRTYNAVKKTWLDIAWVLTSNVGKNLMKSASFPYIKSNKRQSKTLSRNERQSKTLSTQIISFRNFCSSAKLCLGEQFPRNTVARSYCWWGCCFSLFPYMSLPGNEHSLYCVGALFLITSSLINELTLEQP